MDVMNEILERTRERVDATGRSLYAAGFLTPDAPLPRAKVEGFVGAIQHGTYVSVAYELRFWVHTAVPEVRAEIARYALMCRQGRFVSHGRDLYSLAYIRVCERVALR
jgi:hypothetical protein